MSLIRVGRGCHFNTEKYPAMKLIIHNTLLSDELTNC